MNFGTSSLACGKFLEARKDATVLDLVSSIRYLATNAPEKDHEMSFRVKAGGQERKFRCQRPAALLFDIFGKARAGLDFS